MIKSILDKIDNKNKLKNDMQLKLDSARALINKAKTSELTEDEKIQLQEYLCNPPLPFDPWENTPEFSINEGEKKDIFAKLILEDYVLRLYLNGVEFLALYPDGDINIWEYKDCEEVTEVKVDLDSYLVNKKVVDIKRTK
jgi:hypothetical protein